MKSSINKFIEDYEANSDEYYGFYDWFCNTNTLNKRAKGFIPKLKFLVKEGIVNGDECYVWFKNNCPVGGSLYDDMRISRLDNEDFLGGFCPRTGHNTKEKAAVWTLPGEFKEYTFLNWTDLKKEIKNNSSFKNDLIKAFN